MEVPETTTEVLHNELVRDNYRCSLLDFVWLKTHFFQELRNKLEEETEELQRVIEEKNRDAEENDKHLKAQIEKLNKRLEKVAIRHCSLQ